MKKIILLAGVFSLVSLHSFAQRNPHNNIETGLKIGGNMSTLSGGASQDFKPSYHFGGFIEFPLSYYKKTALQIELMYSSQGYKGKEYDQKFIEITESGTNIKSNGKLKLDDVSLNYVYLPVMFKYYVSDNFSVEVGGQIGYMVGASGQFDINKANPARGYLSMAQSDLDEALFEAGYRSRDRKDYYEDLDYGVNAGFTANFNNGMFVSGRFYYGLQDVYKKDNDLKKMDIPTRQEGMSDAEYAILVTQVKFINDNLNFDPLANMVIQLSVGYRF